MVDCKKLADSILDAAAKKNMVRIREKPVALEMVSYGGDGDGMAKGLEKDCQRVGVEFRRRKKNTTNEPRSFIFCKNNSWRVIDSGAECVSEAVWRILRESLCLHDTAKGINVLVIGRGNVGMHVIDKLLEKDASIMIAHSKTDYVTLGCMEHFADAIVTCCSTPNLFGESDFLWTTAPIIDCGFELDDNEKPCGNVVAGSCPNQTPVPGGVGLVTRAIMVEKAVDMA